MIFFTTGLNATLEVFAHEMLELWLPGLTIDNVVYRIALVNGIFDGKGYEQVTKTRGSCSLEGCNACDFPGYKFGKGPTGSVVYPFYSRYLLSNDSRRLKRPLRVKYASNMYNISTEINNPPIEKTCENYIGAGKLFESNTDRKILHINGVKGIWAFHILPYASLIVKTKDRMHTSDHVINDALKVLCKSKDNHSNRTEKAAVRSACQANKIFPFLYTPDENGKPKTIPWFLNKKTYELHDLKLRCVIGAKSVEVPKKILKKKKGRTTAESIMYGVNGWASWCLHSDEVEEFTGYVDNKLKLFDVLRILNSNKINLTDVNSIRMLTIDALVEHSALFPPCEQTYALHELIHVVEQIPKIRPANLIHCLPLKELMLPLNE